MLTMSRHGLGDLQPIAPMPRRQLTTAVVTASLPSLPPVLTPTAAPPSGASWGHAPPAAAVIPGTVPAQEGRPVPVATQPTATVTAPTGEVATVPVALPGDVVVATAPKRWPWVVGGVAAAAALALGTQLLRR